MVLLNTLSPEPAGSQWVIEASTSNFMKEVVEASAQVPVLLYFTASWCGPCKQLGPALEKCVNEAAGSVHLVRVDVDKNQQIAAQFQIQSVPTVYMFQNGQPVDGFQGAIPESQIKQFIARFAGKAQADISAEHYLEEAQRLLAEGDATSAETLLNNLLAAQPDNANAIAELGRIYIAQARLDEASALFVSLPADIRKNVGIAAAITALDLARAGQDAGDITQLKQTLAGNPLDHDTRLKLANALYAAGNIEPAIDELFTIITQDMEWNEQAARKQLLNYFEAIGNAHPLSKQGRRRLSTMLFS